MQTWQLQQAKAQLSELVRRAQTEGPQEISVRGRPSVVVISEPNYQRLMKSRPGLVEFLRNSPLAGLDLDLTRDKTTGRDVKL